jgi:hypothetical protein
MQTSLKQQKGMTFISLIFLLGLIGFFVLLLFKIGPIYLSHSKVTEALKALKESPNLKSMSEFEIRNSLSKQFNMNYVDDVSLEDIVITKSGGYTKVSIEYDVIEQIFGNLSVLVEFKDEIEAGGNE